jgi:hypothetical protein
MKVIIRHRVWVEEEIEVPELEIKPNGCLTDDSSEILWDYVENTLNIDGMDVDYITDKEKSFYEGY